MLVIGTWLRKYWYVLLIGAALFAFAAIAYRKHTDLGKLLDETQQRHKKEIEDLVAHHDRDITARDQAIAKYHEQLLSIETQYEEAKKELELRKRVNTKKIIDETKGDPDKLAHKLAESTGFKIIVPKE